MTELPAPLAGRDPRLLDRVGLSVCFSPTRSAMSPRIQTWER